jgi:hypothetical protein
MNGDCRQICTAPWQTSLTAQGSVWQAYVVALTEWSYATIEGRVLVDHQPDYGEEMQFLGSNEFPMPVAIGWDGSQWHVSALIGVRNPSSLLPDLVCASAWAEIQFNDLAPPTYAGWQAVTFVYIPGAPVAAGCLLVLTAPGIRPVLLLHRFGVLLAANDSAQHSLGRVLPIADAYEQAIAQQLAQKLPGIAGAGGNG